MPDADEDLEQQECSLVTGENAKSTVALEDCHGQQDPERGHRRLRKDKTHQKRKAGTWQDAASDGVVAAPCSPSVFLYRQ